MTPKLGLGASHLRTYEKLFQHPIARNLEWNDVRTLLAELGQITEGHNGHLTMARNGHSLVLHRPHSKDITDVHELMEIRHFLERSDAPLAHPDSNGEVLVVISHHDARIFHSDLHGASAGPFSSHDTRYFDHASGSKDFSQGKENPAPVSYFEPLAVALKPARKILLFGCGVGKTNEMQQFKTWLGKHDPELASRIVGSENVDEHHVSDGELLAKARSLFAGLPAAAH
jgi:hypothetical protein